MGTKSGVTVVVQMNVFAIEEWLDDVHLIIVQDLAEEIASLVERIFNNL